MFQKFRATAVFVGMALAAACGGAEDAPAPQDQGSSQGSGGAAGAATTSSSSGAGSTSSSSVGAGGSGGQAPAPEPQPEGLDDLGTLVVLGDSIGDGGGQGPYYYQLLPSALEGHYGKALEFHNRADSGSKTSALVGQVDSLPNSLPGPVAVTITSGGNDMKDHLYEVLLGLDGVARAQMGANIAAALDALLVPDRFGVGVEVHVFYATIYDASDGQGNFGSGGCVIEIDSPSSTDPFFASWNGEIETQVQAVGQNLADMHGLFYGHGFNNPPKWYANDCTHPNSTGHDELQGLFYEMITGEPLL